MSRTAPKQIINISDIDWNDIYKKQKEKYYNKRKLGPDDWNKRAPFSADHEGISTYSNAFLKIIKPHRSWTVLDMGCGGGRLAVPLAGKVKEVTAVDFSGRMLEVLAKESRKHRLTNIRTINAAWEDNWEKSGIGIYDVAIASRSLPIDDLREAATKLINAAQKRVYISTIVDDGPFDRKIFEAVGRELTSSPDYIYVYNIIYQMGIKANISFIVDKKNPKKFENQKAAMDSYKWIVQDMTQDKEELLRKYLHEHLICQDGNWMLDYTIAVKWAVIWWDKNSKNSG